WPTGLKCILGDRFLVYMSSTAPLLLHPPIRSEICTLPSFSGIAQTHMPDVLTLCRAALKTNVVVCGAANFGTDRAAGIDNWCGHVAAWRCLGRRDRGGSVGGARRCCPGWCHAARHSGRLWR